VHSGVKFACSRGGERRSRDRRKRPPVRPEKQRNRISLKCGCLFHLTFEPRGDGLRLRTSATKCHHTNGCDPSAQQLRVAQRKAGARIPLDLMKKLASAIQLNLTNQQLLTFISLRENSALRDLGFANMSADQLRNLKLRVRLAIQNGTIEREGFTTNGLVEEIAHSEEGGVLARAQSLMGGGDLDMDPGDDERSDIVVDVRPSAMQRISYRGRSPHQRFQDLRDAAMTLVSRGATSTLMYDNCMKILCHLQDVQMGQFSFRLRQLAETISDDKRTIVIDQGAVPLVGFAVAPSRSEFEVVRGADARGDFMGPSQAGPIASQAGPSQVHCEFEGEDPPGSELLSAGGVPEGGREWFGPPADSAFRRQARVKNPGEGTGKHVCSFCKGQGNNAILGSNPHHTRATCSFIRELGVLVTKAGFSSAFDSLEACVSEHVHGTVSVRQDSTMRTAHHVVVTAKCTRLESAGPLLHVNVYNEATIRESIASLIISLSELSSWCQKGSSAAKLVLIGGKPRRRAATVAPGAPGSVAVEVSSQGQQGGPEVPGVSHVAPVAAVAAAASDIAAPPTVSAPPVLAPAPAHAAAAAGAAGAAAGSPHVHGPSLRFLGVTSARIGSLDFKEVPPKLLSLCERFGGDSVTPHFGGFTVHFRVPEGATSAARDIDINCVRALLGDQCKIDVVTDPGGGARAS